MTASQSSQPSQASKRLKIFAGVGILLAVLLLAAFTLTWESAALSRAVLGALSGPDLEVQASSVRLSLLRGVLLREVKVHAKLEGGTLDLAAEDLRLSHRFWRLFAGEVAVDEITLKKPIVSVVWDAPAAAGKHRRAGETQAPPAVTPAEAAAGGLALAMSVRRLAIEDGSFLMSEIGTPGEMVRFDGLDVELQDLAVDPAKASLVAGLSAKGTIAAERFESSGVVALGVTGRMTIADRLIHVADLALPIDFGTVVLPRLDLDLGRDPYTFSLAGAGDPLLTAKLLGAASGFGNARLEFELDGDGSPRGGPRGKGSLAVAAGTLGEMPLLSRFEALLAGTQVIGRPYAPFTIPFQLSDGHLLAIAPFAVEAGSLRMAAVGRIDLDGPLDLRLEVSLPRAEVAVKEIPNEALEALTDVDGRVKLQIVVGGTIDQPALRFDHRAWAGLAGRRLAAEALRRLFG